MELDGLLGSTKWQILQIIADEPKSPMQIAEQLGTSVANISSQLRLLEVANIVRKTKTGNVQAGKPRFLFSLSNDFLFMSVMTQNQQAKFLVEADPLHQCVAAVWQLPKQIHKIVLRYVFAHDLFDQNVYVHQMGNAITLFVEKVKTPKKEKITLNNTTYIIEQMTSKDVEAYPQICFGGES